MCLGDLITCAHSLRVGEFLQVLGDGGGDYGDVLVAQLYPQVIVFV